MESHILETKLYEEKNRFQNAFLQIAEHLSSDKNIQSPSLTEKGDVLQSVLDFSRELLCAEKCALFLVDISEKSLVLEKVSGTVDFERLKDVATYDITKANEPGSGVTPWVLIVKKPFNARNFMELRQNSEGHWRGNWDAPMYGGQEEAKNKFQCLYMVPLLAGNKAVGVLKYENRTNGEPFFDDNDERLIDMIAALVTNLVISQRIERNRYDEILPTISTTLISHFGQPSFYDELLEKSRIILSADFCSLFLLDDQKNLNLKSIMGVDNKKKKKLTDFGYLDYQKAEGMTPWILRRGTSFNVRNFPDLRGRSEKNHIGKWDGIVYDGKPEEKFKSLYSVPLIIGDERIGVFKVENKNVPPYYFTESDERLFDLIGRLIAIGVRYEKSHENEKFFMQMAKAAEMGFLAAGISHQFNNYLQNFLDTAQNALDISREPKVKGKLQLIMHDVNDAADMIKNFRNIRNRVQDTVTFDLDVVIKQIMSMTEKRFEAHKIQCSYTNTGIQNVHLNPTDIQTILINLINNAFEAIVETNKAGHVYISTHSAPSNDNFIIEVADSGPGVLKEKQPMLFSPFYTTKPGGMGVGLFWVKRLVNGMNGSIDIISPNDMGGATFKVSLPKNLK